MYRFLGAEFLMSVRSESIYYTIYDYNLLYYLPHREIYIDICTSLTYEYIYRTLNHKSLESIILD